MTRNPIHVTAAALGLASALAAAPTIGATLEAERIAVSAATFGNPHDLVLAPDKSRLYVADLGNNVVKVLDPMSLKTIGRIGQGDLAQPHDVAFDSQGRLMVADSGNDRIVVFKLSPGGARRVAAWGQGLSSPEGVSAGRRGLVYATDTGGGGVAAYRDGKPVMVAGKNPKSRRDAFARPHDVHVHADGRVFVADSSNHRIKILNSTLGLVRILGRPAFNFNEPKYVTFDGRGWMYVADEYNNQVKVFDRDFKPLLAIGSGKQGDGPDQLNQPEGVEVWRDMVWISDTYNHRILLYRLTGLP